MHKLQEKHQKQNGSELCVMATGGGAFKYYEEIRKALGVEVLREDEMECLIIGKQDAARNHLYVADCDLLDRSGFLHSGDPLRSLHS